MIRSFLRSFFLSIVVVLLAFSLAWSQSLSADSSYYVVIGAFAIPKNAIAHTAKAKEQHYDARYALNPNRKLVYVYVLNTEDRMAAIDEAVKLQNQSSYPDTWVFKGLLGENPQAVKIELAERKEAEKKLETSPVVGVGADLSNTNSTNEAKPLTKKFFFKVIAFATRDTVESDIEVFDADAVRSTKVGTYLGNNLVQVAPLKNKSGSMLVVCDVFGYRKLQYPLNFNTPEQSDVATIQGDTVLVPFELVRLQKGDKATMMNVYFYKDAAVMRAESRSEAGDLLHMLNENPKYKIRIHGHTNGNAQGKIITMGDSKDFFSLKRENKQARGSATKLSLRRAEVIQQYLIQNGIAPDRTQVIAWGGKQPIYEVDHMAAQANVRVEIEILDN